MTRAVLAALLLLAPAAAGALPPDTWVLSIGDNAGAPDNVGLLYAERDAQDLADVLRQQGHVSSERIQVLLGEKAEVVRRALVELNSTLRAKAQDGRPTALVVFYSGHADATALHLDGTDLALDELKGLVAGSPAGVRLLVLDACRSGTVTRVKGVRAAPSFELGLQDQVAASGLAIVTSSAAGESSQESDRLRGSFFTHHLINALRGAADQDGDGRITLAEAYDYAYAQTVRSSGQTLQLQHPTYSWDIKGRGVLVLSEPAELRGRVGQLRLAGPATYLVLEGGAGGNLEAEVTTAAEGRELALPAGPYFVQQRLPAEYREYRVEVPVGARVDLSAEPYQDVRYDRLVRQRGGAAVATSGVELLGGARGGVLPGEGLGPVAVAGYAVDLPWLTLGARVEGASSAGDGVDGRLPRRHTSLGLGATVQRVIDLPQLSVGFGLLVEGQYHVQTFSPGARDAATRTAFGAAFGGILSVERGLWRGLAARVEGGPMTELFPAADEGRGDGDGLASPFTGWVAGGLVWRI
jgi:hypothetical protein